MTDIRDNNTPEPQVAKEMAARKAANLRAIQREQMIYQEDAIAHSEHYLYRRDAARAAAVQARAEADARRAAAAREMSRNAPKPPSRP